MNEALEQSLKVLTMKPTGLNKLDMLQFYSDKMEKVMQYLEEETKMKDGLKWHMVTGIQFVKYAKDGEKV